MRDFFKYALASFVALLLFVTLGVGGLVLLVVAISTASQQAAPAVDEKTVLTIDLSQPITDSPPNSNPGSLVDVALADDQDQRPIALRTAIDAIEAAAEDENIVGLYLHGTVSPTGGAGFASLREFRQALQAFRDTGKPIFAYEMDWQERDYYLTSIANTLIMNPDGAIELNGFRSETLFFAEALQKYGVGIQVIRAGRYKSAVEPFLRSNNSPENRQQVQQLLNDLWNEFLTTAAKSRNLQPQQLQAIANSQGMILAEQAQQSKLIDRVAYFDEVLTDLRKLTGEEEEDDIRSFRQITLPDYAEIATENSEQSDSQNIVAVVYAEGNIVSGEGGTDSIGGDRLSRQLRQLREDEDVKAIVLRINSPGGSASASGIITREVYLTRQVKPVIVSMGTVAASGGYEIATYANKIFASPNTITGSIGVYGLLPNVQRIANNNGITWDVVKTAPFADSDTISRPRTPQELAVQQRMVDRIYDRFLDSVSESRSLPRSRVEQLAQGRVWSGIDAKQVGLVDELGGLETAIQAAAETAKLGDDWRVEEYPRNRSFEQQLLERFFSRETTPSTGAIDPLTLQLQNLKEDFETLQSLNDPRGIYTRLPFDFRID